jgi:hypothetical protein
MVVAKDRLLRAYGAETHVMRLQGFLFFATGADMVGCVERRLERAKRGGAPPLVSEKRNLNVSQAPPPHLTLQSTSKRARKRWMDETSSCFALILDASHCALAALSFSLLCMCLPPLFMTPSLI